jgi:hypothetical protein
MGSAVGTGWPGVIATASGPGTPRVGSIELAIPRLCSGSYFPRFLEPRRRSRSRLGLLGRVRVDGAYVADLLPGMLLLASGLGLGLPAPQNAALHGSTCGDAGLAGGVITCIQQLGAAAGLSVLATLAFRHTAARSGRLGAQAVVGYRLAFQAAALVVAAGAVLVLFVRDRTHPGGLRAAGRGGRDDLPTGCRDGPGSFDIPCREASQEP